MPRGFALWLLIVSTGSLILEWLNRSMSDGKVTLSEGADLIERLGRLWGFKVELDLPLPQVLTENEEHAGDETGVEIDLESERTPPKVE